MYRIAFLRHQLSVCYVLQSHAFQIRLNQHCAQCGQTYVAHLLTPHHVRALRKQAWARGRGRGANATIPSLDSIAPENYPPPASARHRLVNGEPALHTKLDKRLKCARTNVKRMETLAPRSLWKRTGRPTYRNGRSTLLINQDMVLRWVRCHNTRVAHLAP